MVLHFAIIFEKCTLLRDGSLTRSSFRPAGDAVVRLPARFLPDILPEGGPHRLELFLFLITYSSVTLPSSGACCGEIQVDRTEAAAILPVRALLLDHSRY